MSQNKEFEQKKPTVATETDSLSRGCMLLGQAGADQSKKMVRGCKGLELSYYTAGALGLIHSTTQAFVGTLYLSHVVLHKPESRVSLTFSIFTVSFIQ